MRKLLTLLCAILLAGSSVSVQKAAQYRLRDFYGNNTTLDKEVDAVYARLSPEQRVAQMIVTSLGKLGKPYAAVEPLIQDQVIGGILFLSGEPEAFKTQIAAINEMSRGNPLIMSMDAEPSLFNRRLPGTETVKPTVDLQSAEEVRNAVATINRSLHHIGFQHNYAPVIDMSPENEAIGNRAFGSDSASIVPLALEFVKATQKDQILATVKHFPGHGRVSGDTHEKLVFIDGALTEVGLYRPMIEAGVLSIMVGHIAIRNNEKYQTDGLPSTLSKVVVTDLLRNEMGFDGLIVTDALNMGAVASIDRSPFLAAKAGCDLILMPPDERGVHQQILEEIAKDSDFAAQIEASVKRIIRAKLCLGMTFN